MTRFASIVGGGALVLLLASCQGTVMVAQPECTPGTADCPCDSADPARRCAATERCVDSLCVPRPSQACSPERPFGLCSDGQVCAAGSCTPTPQGQECSEAQPNGLCPGGQICVEGICYPAPELLCAEQNPLGYCPEGQRCQSGACVPADDEPCSSTAPTGTCEGLEQCMDDSCELPPIPPCDETHPAGTCPADRVCVAGTCVPIVPDNQCSPDRPAGLCPDGFVCDQGVCWPIDPGEACTPTNQSGLCDAGATCVSGSCVVPPCDAEHQLGGCAEPDWQCVAGECEHLPCGPFNPSGSCESAEVCEASECVCDVTCGGPCGTPLVCDDDAASASCGQCICDTTCGDACTGRTVCDNVLGSLTCGECICDITCDGACTGTDVMCDDDPTSPTCGECICDTACGDSCIADRERCDSNPQSATCGECVCDTSCGSICDAEHPCDDDPFSDRCGMCACVPTCATSCGPGEICDTDLDSPTCGECACDTTCDDACVGPNERCDSDLLSPTCGQCICDPTCGGGHPCPRQGIVCDADLTSPTCGTCVCDTTCIESICRRGRSCDDDLTSASCGSCICESEVICPYFDECCAVGAVCRHGLYCRPTCATGQYCGATDEICCASGYECGDQLRCQRDCGANEVCGENLDVCCAANETCVYHQCIPKGATCTTFEDCDFDEYCEQTLDPPSCLKTDLVGGSECRFDPPENLFASEIEWHWLGARADRSECTSGADCYRNVMVAAFVADMDRVDETQLTWTSPMSGHTQTFSAGKYPEVVFKAYRNADAANEAIVILDGRTGQTKRVITNASYHGNVAVANLDGDAKLEIVHATGNGIRGLDPFYLAGDAANVSWTQNSGSLNRQLCGGAPTITDLNADGQAEVVMGGVVVDGRTGNVLADFGADNQGGGPTYPQTGVPNEWWYISAVADVDIDGRPEVVVGNKAIEVRQSCDWRTPACGATQHCENNNCVANSGSATWSWRIKWDASAVIGPGFPGIGNFVDNTEPPYNESDDPPEVVVTIDGEVAFLHGQTGALMKALDNTTDLFFELLDWRGGAPNIADFDGDGRVETSFAGRGCMVVVDVDCAVATPALRAARPAGCNVDPATVSVCTQNLHPNTTAAEMGQMMGVLWMFPTQDESSAATGTSVFDFQGDGTAEVLYNDECFFRVFNGDDGTLYMERPNSSRTGSEYPIVVDVDGDRDSEIIVVANNDQAGMSRDSCASEPTENPRGAYWSDHEYYEAAFCTGATNTPRVDDAYNICREGTWGVWSYGDITGQWVKTLPYWNQHAYHLTEIDRDGNAQADWGAGNNNWDKYNNYRQNRQGAVPLNAPNLQITELTVGLLGCPDTIHLTARLENAGSAGYQPNPSVPVYVYRDIGAGWELFDTIPVTDPIPPGRGLTVSYEYTVQGYEVLTGFRFVVNDDEVDPPPDDECLVGDNATEYLDDFCPVG